MADNKDQIPGPDREPEEKKYSFLQETIKPKPISRQQLVRQLVRIAIYGVILGVFACLGFFALKPWVQDKFRGDLETVTIPEDEDPDEAEERDGTEEDGAEEQTDTEQPLTAESYEQIMASMNERAEEAKKGIVSVEAESEQTDWEDEMNGIKRSATGVITADKGQETLIMADQ